MLDDATLLGACMLGSLVLYALFGGADFGGGVWHLLATGPRARQQRELVASAIAPIWEANHVWLILVVVVLFTGFPVAFAEIATRLHAPLTALLIAIVIRGSAFAFRSASGDRPVEERGWGTAFGLASVAAPMLLGMTLATLSSGRLPDSALRLSWRGPWLMPFALAAGLFTLALFAYLAAVFLTVDAAEEAQVQEDFRRRAIGTGVLSGALALVTFRLPEAGAPLVRQGLANRSWSWPLHLLTGMAAIAALGSLVARRFRVARVCAVLQVALVVLGWGASQYPFLVVPTITLGSASASPATQRMLLWALAAGAALLFPCLCLLFRVFKGRLRGRVGAR
jgi:cytochrome d ubiquinol oxidase subunit II